jgi:hypothetical protein
VTRPVAIASGAVVSTSTLTCVGIAGWPSASSTVASSATEPSGSAPWRSQEIVPAPKLQLVGTPPPLAESRKLCGSSPFPAGSVKVNESDWNEALRQAPGVGLTNARAAWGTRRLHSEVSPTSKPSAKTVVAP